jgi:hypothetical protein
MISHKLSVLFSCCARNWFVMLPAILCLDRAMNPIPLCFSSIVVGIEARVVFGRAVGITGAAVLPTQRELLERLGQTLLDLYSTNECQLELHQNLEAGFHMHSRSGDGACPSSR